MRYAIIEAGGRQIWVKPGQFYDINYITAQPGDIIKLNRVLLINTNDQVIIGKPCIKNFYIKAKILKHIKSKKTVVFKMKAKKNQQTKTGHRQNKTRIFIEQVVNLN
uniref:Large ribosomal subunit protein bL21m n=1 Tax=Gastroclonium compressum TaxID=1852973 RepID=A0A173FZS4_GASCM|nr:ribosomal protein L21 [Coeloseira compressa]ANH09531.1 ribosomal protein L21 [Coeloseira compressa]